MKQTDDILKKLDEATIATLREPSIRPCGCGTFHDALKIATANVAKYVALDNPCVRWFVLVNSLEAMLMQNMQIIKTAAEFPDEASAVIQLGVDAVFEKFEKSNNEWISANAAAVVNMINGPIREAWNKEKSNER